MNSNKEEEKGGLDRDAHERTGFLRVWDMGAPAVKVTCFLIHRFRKNRFAGRRSRKGLAMTELWYNGGKA